MTQTKKLYLRLFHGRHHPEDKLNDWGFDGPIFGPLAWVHGTYAADLKLGYPEDFQFCRLNMRDDLVYYDGKYYGDWSACMLTNREVFGKLVKFEEDKT